MRIEMKRDRPGGASACVVILNAEQSVKLNGIIVRETRRSGWLSIDLPPLEDWAESLKRLTQQQRDRITSPAFYQLLQKALSERYGRLKL